MQEKINHRENHYTVSSGYVSNLKSWPVEDRSTTAHSTIFGLEMLKKDIIVENSQDNLQSNGDYLETKSESYNKISNNEQLLHFENSINDSDVKSDHLLKPMKRDNNGDCMPHNNAYCLPIVNSSRAFGTTGSSIPAKQGNRALLSGNCAEIQIRAEDLTRGTCSVPEGSSRTGVDRTQSDEGNEKKRKRRGRNKKRKGRSTEEDVEGLQEQYVSHGPVFELIFRSKNLASCTKLLRADTTVLFIASLGTFYYCYILIISLQALSFSEQTLLCFILLDWDLLITVTL
jgi:hypothetical protein